MSVEETAGGSSTWQIIETNEAAAKKGRRRPRHLILIALLAAFDYALFRLSYWTEGDLPSALWFLFFLGNLPIALKALFGRSSRAVRLAVVLALIAAPVPLFHGARLLLLRADALAIAEFAADYRAAEGHYPETLPDHVRQWPGLDPFLTYARADPDTIWIRYSVDGSFFTSYTCKNGPRKMWTRDTEGDCVAWQVPPKLRGCTQHRDYFYESD